MHICTVTIAIVHKCTILHPLMWVFFGLNCVKGLPISILQNYPSADVIALIEQNKISILEICWNCILRIYAQN